MPFIPDQPTSGFVPDKNQAPQRKGAGKWWLGNRTSLPGMALEAGSNLLNLPSYGFGGGLKEVQNIKKGTYQAPKTGFTLGKNRNGRTLDVGELINPALVGVVRGLKNKNTVMRELPSTVGLNPDSAAGVAVGLAGEIALPSPAELGNVFKGTKAASRLRPNVFSKLGGVTEDAGNTLLMKSYKLNASDIDKIAKSIGVTNEAEKSSKVLAYLEGMGLNGSTMGSAKKLDTLTQGVQDSYNALVRTGRPVGRETYAQALYDQAAKLEKFAGDPASRRIVNELLDESERQMKFAGQKVGMTDTFLTNTKTKAFSAASPGQISSPFETGFNEQIGRAGVNALDTIAPGSKAIGTKLRGMQTAQDVVGAKARTGLGTQLLNAFKPSAIGVGAGAAYGYSQGENPLTYGVVGGLGGVAANNPKILNLAGKALTNTSKYSPAINKGFSVGAKVAGRSALTGARLSGANLGGQNDRQSQVTPPAQFPRVGSTTALPMKQGYKEPTTYQASIPPTASSSTKLKPIKYEPPRNIFSNKSTFGSTKKVQRGSFY